MAQFWIGWREGRATSFEHADTPLDEFKAWVKADEHLDEITIIEAKGHSLSTLSATRAAGGSIGPVVWTRSRVDDQQRLPL